MSILFVHPPLGRNPSGGNLFNANLISRARQNRYPLTSFPIEQDQFSGSSMRNSIPGKHGLVLWDSLFIETLAERNIKLPGSASSLLVHYLPSENPKLGCTERLSLQAMEDKALAKLQCLIATGARIQKILMERFSDKRVALSEPGVDPLFWSNRNSKPEVANDPCVRLLTVANLLPAKGYLELLKIFQKLFEKKIHWHIVGDERCDRNYADEFWLTVERLELSEHIIYHGVLTPSRLRDLMVWADLLVSASYFEAYGMALAEAVATGLPVVTTRVGEAGRLVCHGQTGYLVPVGAWESMAGYIAEMIDNNSLRDRFRENALKRKPRTWEQTFEDFRTACRPWCL